ncbi:MAG: short-chain dehydrogenase [Pseudomonadales bacterium]|nr:short-chain dehydrogenase [Pseudomonadales bacterium]RLU01442.1 MAG: SDR family oxidoreductase [Ketobacter sp.]
MSSVFQPNQLQGKTALITGAGSGINKGIALHFARHGANVVMVGRRQEKLDATQAEIEAEGGRALGCSADVRDYDALAAAAAKGAEVFGSYSIVIAGAAGNFIAPAVSLSANGFGSVIDIDLKGTFNTFRACSEHFTEADVSLIAISAPQAVNPMPFQTHACSAKAGIEMLIKTLAIEWGPRGVRVNGLSPGYVADTVGGNLFMSEDGGETLKQRIPLQRVTNVQEMAEMALMLCTPVSAYMTGHVVALDGGVSLVGGGAWQH